MKQKYIAIAVRVEKEVKEEATRLFDDIGLTVAEALKIFIYKCLEEKRIPFEYKINMLKK
jgi:addiction module RelB/DinJ family antitoxin